LCAYCHLINFNVPKNNTLIKSNKKWELNSSLSSPKKISGESSDTPNLLKVKKLDDSSSSSKRNRHSSEIEANKMKLISQTSSDDGQTPISKVSSKPPLNKRVAKAPSQKPQIQGYLYKRKHPKLSTSNSSINSIGSASGGATSGGGGSGSGGNHISSTKALIRNLSPKWKMYWCVLVKVI
jgi:hypothetical protein